MFYDLSENRQYYLDVPELHGKVICGSNYGWLFTLDRKLNFRLVNPLTHECYNIPSPSPYFVGYFDGNKHALALYQEAESDDEEVHGKMRKKFEKLQRILVIKAILDYDPSKRSDFTVFILYGEDEIPSFWRPGNDDWTDIPDFPSYLSDIAFYKDKFYAVSRPVMELINGYFADTYIVDLDGEFLLVERFLKNFRRKVTIEFVVHKIDLDEKSYATYQHIDKHAIFLGSNSAVVINPDQFSSCTKDAIYFTDIDFGYIESYSAKDHGIFDLIGNHITSCFPRDIFRAPLVAPIWFTPNP